MSYRVCIPTAGTGSRLGELTKYINKSLVSLANRPILSHIIELFPQECEFVIALGHRGNLVREFLELAYPGRSFFYSEVSPYEGPGSGLGLSLLACRQHLQQPFVFISCDTLVEESIPAPDHNWMAYAEAPNLSPYRTLKVEADRVAAICEKGIGETGTHKPYIGLAGISDYSAFWAAMESGGDAAVETGESHGLRGLLDRGVSACRFTWHDTGIPEALAAARQLYQEPDAPNILEKANEAIWFVGDRVIKYSDDRSFIANRVLRSRELGDYIPSMIDARANMYSYRRAPGCVFSEVSTRPLFLDLLAHSRNFWQVQALEPDSLARFGKVCRKFYRDKTLERVQLFYRVTGRRDGTEAINDCPMPTLASMLEKLDWDWMAEGLPGRFHGDFHFENILWSEATRKFVFLDWRQDFGGDISIGDIYYDLAKLLHGLIVNHELISKDQYQIDWKTSAIQFDLLRKHRLVECESTYYGWLADNGYDVEKVRVLTALIYLNIAALHHDPYRDLLYALGKYLLADHFDRRNQLHDLFSAGAPTTV